MLTLGELIDRNGRSYGDKDAYVELDRRRSWRQLAQRTDALAHVLRSWGVKPGDRVGVMLKDSIEVVEVIGACAKLGAIHVGLNSQLASAEIGILIEDSGIDILFVQSGLLETARVALERRVVKPTLVGIGANHSLEWDFEALVAKGGKQGVFRQTPGDRLMICYTTGATGLPKGAIYPHRPLLDSMASIALAEGATPDDVWLHAMPASGMPIIHLLSNIFHGTKCAIVGEWDTKAALTLIERERATICVLVPTMLRNLLTSGLITKYDCSSIRQIGYGSDPIPPTIIREALKAFGCRFLQMYGTTELMGISMMLTATDHERALKDGHSCIESAGRPLFFVDTKVIDEDGNELPDGQVGELLIKTPYVIPGYWNQDAQYSETVREGWLHTGDIAVMDEEGFIYLKGRTKFRIKSGGYNIYPVEIEKCILEHEDVDEVSVFGLPDSKWGNRIHAVVTLCESAKISGEDLREYCRGKIANFKIPKQVEIWERLPKGPNGKIQKREIIDICKSTQLPEVAQ